MLGAIAAAIAGCNRRGVVLTYLSAIVRCHGKVPLLDAMVGAIAGCHCWMLFAAFLVGQRNAILLFVQVAYFHLQS